MSSSASSHWILQRLSAIVLIPLSLFSLYKILNLFNGNESFINLFHSPFSLFLIILFVFFGLYHASMGMEVIAEDYIQNKFKQRSTIALLRFINLTTFAFLIFTIVIGFTMLNDTQIEMKQNSQNIQEEQKIN